MKPPTGRRGKTTLSPKPACATMWPASETPASVARRLVELSEVVDGEMVGLFAHHANGVARGSRTDLEVVAEQFESLGALLVAAEGLLRGVGRLPTGRSTAEGHNVGPQSRGTDGTLWRCPHTGASRGRRNGAVDPAGEGSRRASGLWRGQQRYC